MVARIGSAATKRRMLHCVLVTPAVQRFARLLLILISTQFHVAAQSMKLNLSVLSPALFQGQYLYPIPSALQWPLAAFHTVLYGFLQN